MDIALKQRMVGASVLIALGVIFIPMILEGPDPEGTQSVDLEIPPISNSRILPVGDASTSQQTPPPESRAVEAPAASEPARDRADETPPAESLAGAETTSDANEDARVDEVPASEEQQPLSPPAVAAAEPAPQRQTPAAAQPTTASTEVWAVQVGSFRSQSSAVDLTSQLLAADFPAYLESLLVRDAQLYRIRVGPLADENEAQTVATQIKGRLPSLTPAVMSPDKMTSAATVMSTWSVQLGSFRDRENANSLRDRLRQAGHPAYIRIVGASFRVLVGPELDRASIDGVRSEIDREFGISGIVVST